MALKIKTTQIRRRLRNKDWIPLAPGETFIISELRMKVTADTDNSGLVFISKPKNVWLVKSYTKGEGIRFEY